MKFVSKIAVLILSYSLFIACGEFPLGTNPGSVSGSLFNDSFSIESATAESDGTNYTVTLSDAAAFQCGSREELPSSFLYIDISNIDPDTTPTTFQASGKVYFNKTQDDANTYSEATRGNVSIDEITATNIRGSIDASGPDGSVSGSFSAEICN